jgi:hypothetical protein
MLARRTSPAVPRYRTSVRGSRTGTARKDVDRVTTGDTTVHTTVHTPTARETSAIVPSESRPRSARSTIAASPTGRVIAVHGRLMRAIVHRVADPGTIVHAATAIARRDDHLEGARSMTAAAPIEGGRAVHDHSTAGSARRVAARGISSHGTTASGRGARTTTVVVRTVGPPMVVRSMTAAGLTGQRPATRGRSTRAIVRRRAGRATTARGTIARARIVVVHTVNLPMAVRSMTAAGVTGRAPATRGQSTLGIVSRRAGRGTIARATMARNMSARAPPADGRRDTGPAAGAPSTAGVQPGETRQAVTDRTKIGSVPADAGPRAPASRVRPGEIASGRRLALHVRAMGRVHGNARANSPGVTGTTGLVAKALP